MKRSKYLVYAFIVTLVGWMSSDVYANTENGAGQLKVNLSTSFEKELSAFQKQVLPKKDHSTHSSTTDFLMGNSLSKATSSKKSGDIAQADFENFTIKSLEPKRQKKKIQVKELISNDCTEENGRGGKITRCLESYSDGSAKERIDQNFGSTTKQKRQLIITQYDSNGQRIDRKSIRHMKTFTTDGELVAEHVDIVTRPYTGKILREFMIHNIDEKTRNTTKLIWTKYKQIEDQMIAEISHHAVLNFDRTGKAKNGRAEIWDGEKVIDTRLNVDTIKFPAIRVERTSWGQWESRIKNMIQQVQVL